MNQNYQIASEEKKLHAYQFSYDVTTGVYEDPVQAILQEFVVNGVIDCKSSFRLLHGDKVTGKAIIVRPVETTWIFHSELTLAEIGSFIVNHLNKEVKYTISEMQLQEDDVLFKYKEESTLNPMDDELMKAIKAVEEKTKDNSLSAYLKSHLTSLTTYVKSLAVLLLFILGFSHSAWADGINYSGGYIYFDNSLNINKGYIQICGRQSSWTGVSTLSNSNLSHTKLYYVKDPQGSGWGDILGWVVISNSTEKSNSNFDDWSNQGWCTNWNTYGFNSGSTYLIVPSSTSKSQSVTTSYYADGYSGLNHSQTVYKYTSTGGTTASSYTGKQVNSGTVTISAYKLTDNGKASNSNNSGTINTATTTSVSKDAAYTGEVTLEASANDGYSFIGWFENTTATTAVETETSYTYNAPNSTKSIYARFKENQYSITFDANGGSSSMSDQTGLGCATAQTIQANSFTAPAGHHFIGWSETKDGDVVYEDEGTVPALTVTTQGGTLKLYAQWAPNTHTLTWEWNGGSTTDVNYTKAGTVAYGTAIVYPTNASMSYAGHNFTGWDKTISTMPDEDLTITAQWVVASSYTLSFAKGCDDEVTDMPDPITQSTQTFTITSTLPKRTGYTFSVWKDNQGNSYSAGGSITITGNTTLTAVWLANTNTPYIVNHKRQALDGTYPANLTETENKTGTTATAAILTTKNYTGFTTPATQEATILADGSLVVNYEYERQSFNLTWDLNGGTAGTGTITSAGSTKYETVLQYTVDPTRTGYTFTGWNPEMTSGTTTMPAANTTYTAQWQAKTYTVSFDQNGGEGGQTETVTATYNQPMPALATPFTAPVKNGYKFMGYYYNNVQYYTATGTSARTWNVDNNVTLTAKWDQIHVYIEGRFKVRTELDGNTWKYTGAEDGDYVSEGNSTNIEIPFIEAENKYRLNTYLYVNEAAGKIGNENYVLFISTWTQSDGFTKYKANVDEGDNFWFNKDNMSSELTTSGGKNFWFSETTNFGGPIILTYDPVANTLSYTAAPEPTYSVTFIAGGQGHINNRDDVKQFVAPVGIRSGYNITAYPDAGYKFEKWTSTGDVVIAEASNASTSITVTGAGTVTANFVEMKKIYFKKHSNWTGSEVYVYFYEGNHVYWNTDKSPADGNMEKGPTSANLTGNQMTEIDHVNHIYYFAIPDNWNPGNAVAFVNARQDNANPFYNTSVAGRNDFNKCLPYFVSTGDAAYYNKYYDETDKEDKQTAYYSGGYWTSYKETEYYLKGDMNSWKALDEYRFRPTTDPNVFEAVWSNTTANKNIHFKVWQTCDCWYGKSGTDYSGDVENIQLENNVDDTYNISYTAPKVGSYQFKYNVSSQKLSITYMGNIMVQNFPEEVSVITGRQYKITPTVTLREGMTLDDLEITVTGASHAQFTQSGTNLIVLGNSEGTDNVTVTYRNKNTDYSITKDLKVNVATGITLQAKTENTETSWIKTDLVHVHFWSTDGDKAQDASMTYNSESGIYSVTIPKIVDGEGNINFLFWYGENINMLGGNDAKWRQTDNMQTKVEMCYTIGYNSASNAYRVATPETGLCESGAYQIEVSMKNGNTYLSNIVTTTSTSKTFSFFAPKDGDETYKGGTVRLLKDGTVLNTLTGFSQAGVYVADLSGENITTPKLYEGDYYVIAGVSGSELNDDTKMHKFTPRANTAEDYSYYWTVYSGDRTDKNVIAKVANKYNSNLSLTIGADALTQADGKVEAGNVRFSYEPTTNAFKRAILGASNSNDFLNVYGNNVYADAAATQPLNEDQSLDLSKFTDNSDWVYEKVVYVKVESAVSESKVTLKSVFNGQTSHLLGYEIDETTGEEKKDSPNQLTVLGKGSTTSASAYAIRISYDFKKNRLISSWEPTEGTYDSDMSINSDVLFIRTEDDDVQQVQVATKSETESYKISSLQHVMFVMEIDGSTDKKSYSQYWISLPFDCQISDIFGVEGYITLDENRIAQKGTWGIMRYRGDLRAQKGWFLETDGFWEWMYENETMNAGEGYVLFFERESITSWPTIKVGDEEKTLKRLYFPSKDAGFVMSNTVTEENSKFTCESMRCTIKTPEDREAYDSNWRVIGPKSYNNIKAKNIETDNAGTQTEFPNFLYTYDTSKEKGQKYVAHNGTDFNYQSFHSYMVQYEGTITWMPYTQTTPATIAARNVENSDFKGGTLTIELMQNNEQLDRAFVKLDEKGTVGYDFSQDLTKITENCAQIASVSEDVLYAGNTLPLNTELVPLNVKVTANGTYDIALEKSLEGLEVNLFDAFEQTTTPLDLMSATVTLNKGEYKDRFYLQLKQKGSETPTSFEGKIEQYNLPTDKTQKLLINGNIYLINGGRIYNATGAELR